MGWYFMPPKFCHVKLNNFYKLVLWYFLIWYYGWGGFLIQSMRYLILTTNPLNFSWFSTTHGAYTIHDQ